MPGIAVTRMDEKRSEDMNRQLLAHAESLVFTIGPVSEEVVVEFLQKYSIEEVFTFLEHNLEDHDFTESCIKILDRIVRSTSGSSCLSRVLPRVNAGFSVPLPSIKILACTAVKSLLSHGRILVELPSLATELKDSGIICSLLATLEDSNSDAALAASEALLELALSPDGLTLLLESGVFLHYATQSASNVRMRALSLAAKILSKSEAASQAFQQAEIGRALVQELSEPSSDVLSVVGFLQAIQEFFRSLPGSRLLLSSGVVPQICDLVRSASTSSMVRSAAMATAGRLLLTEEKADTPMEQSELEELVESMGSYLTSAQGNFQEREGVVTALDSLGLLGQSKRGAEALLIKQPMAVRHLAEAAFESSHNSFKKQAAIHSLSAILGSERDGTVLLSEEAENSVRNILYSSASKSAWGPSLAGTILALLRQPEEVRCAVYRLLSASVARTWGVYEFCSKPEVLRQVVDSSTETSQPAMEWRHACCVAMAAAVDLTQVRGPPPVSEDVKRELEAAVRRGPYLAARERREAIPTVATMQRM